MKTGYKVGDCMTIHPITVPKESSILDCAKLMAEKHVGSLIVEDKRKLLGLLTEQDMVRKGIAQGKDPGSTPVTDIMISSGEIITIAPNEDLYDALRLMRDYNIRHLPVLDSGTLIGFLTIKDILKIQPQLFDVLVEKFELREESRKPVMDPDDAASVCDECSNFSDDLEEVDGLRLCPTCRGADEEVAEEEEEF